MRKLLISLFLCGCGTVYLDSERRCEKLPEGTKIQKPKEEEKTLSKQMWLLSDKYLMEIHELLGNGGVKCQKQ